jgi:hypothetical protein
MTKSNQYFLIIISLFYSNIIFSQEEEKITLQDYNNYIYNLDKSMIERFGSQRNQWVVKVYNGGNRQYLVTYMDMITQKIIEGPYNGNQHSVLSFENYKVWELERRKKEKDKIELQRKKEIKESLERKKRIEEEKLQKQKENILKERNNVLESKFDTRKFHEFFFGYDYEPGEYLFRYFKFKFIYNKEFITNDEIIEDEIEYIGDLVLEEFHSKSSSPLFKISIGVKDFFDESKIKYFINNIEVDFDLQLKGSKWSYVNKPLKHLKDLYNTNDYLFKNQIINDGFNFPFPIQHGRDFKNFKELIENFGFYNFLYKNRYKEVNEISRIINYLIVIENYRYGKEQFRPGYCIMDDDCLELENLEITTKKSSRNQFIVVINNKRKNRGFIYYINTKKGKVYRTARTFNHYTLKWESWDIRRLFIDDVSKILKGDLFIL